MGKLINALLGAFGFIRYKKRYKKKASFKKFVESCFKAKRPRERLASFILTQDITPEFMSGGIAGATGQGWTHALTCLWDNGLSGNTLEVVESQILVAVDTLKKYDKEDVQMVAFSVSLDDDNFNHLKKQLHSQVGKPYDISEFAKYLGGVFGLLPNFPSLHVCSTLTTYGTKDVYHRWFGRYKELRLVPKGVKREACTPGDIFNGCYPQFKFRVSKYHW